MPALVNSAGSVSTLKLGGTIEPAFTFAVNWVMRSRTRLVVIVTGGPGFAGPVSRISTVWPGNSCDVSVAPSKPPCSAFGIDRPSAFTWNAGLLKVTTVGFPTFTLLTLLSSSSTTISKCVASSILKTMPSSSSSSASSSNSIFLARNIPPAMSFASTSTT